jgi:hypothetical protein
MKITSIATLVCVSLFGLCGCVNMGIDYKDYCWQSCRKTHQCGKCITHHCEKICSACHAQGAACDDCWNCIRDDVCMH